MVADRHFDFLDLCLFVWKGESGMLAMHSRFHFRIDSELIFHDEGEGSGSLIDLRQVGLETGI